jgi:hypothetical protein
VLASLQGTFSMPWWRDGHPQHPEVWSFAGDTLTRWNGTKDETAKVAIVAPCLAKITWASGASTYEEFVIDGDTVWFAEEGGGTYGDRAVICTSRSVWVLDKNGICRAWELALFSPHPSGLAPKDTTCKISDAGVFEADGKRWQQRDEAFFRLDFDKRKPQPPVRYPSLADAKAALAHKSMD